MKKIITATCLFWFVILLGCRLNAGKQVITVSNDEHKYQFEAIYPIGKTAKVKAYLEKNFAKDIPFATGASLDKDVVMANGASYHLKSKPGWLVISFEKKKNTATNYQWLSQCCLEIKELLKTS